MLRLVWMAPGFAFAVLSSATPVADARAAGPGECLRMEVCLNGVWDTAPGTDEKEMPRAGWAPMRTPALPITREGHPAAMWYRRALEIPQELARPDRRFFLEIEKAGHYAAVFCNGREVGAHYGQYAPFEVELTAAIRPGENNEIAVYVHDSSGRFVRAGADVPDAMIGMSYRPGARGAPERNWIGIAGDITFSWRPARRVSDARVVTSVSEKSIRARLDLSKDAASERGIECRATVLDGDREVLTLPAVAATGSRVELQSPWANPVLWGHAPYGEPKLYVLRTELVRDGEVVDRLFTRFGFREVRVEGKDVLLNGRKLWLSGTYTHWLDSRRYVNDRRPMSVELRAMQEAGLNTLNGHWDDLGRTYLELCDEMGLLVWASMYCTSALPLQPNGDEAWSEWMVQTTEEWVSARRVHPSVIAWRPFCAPPRNFDPKVHRAPFLSRVRRALIDADGTRPVGDGSDINDHSQGFLARGSEKFDDAAIAVTRIEEATKPTMTVELWGDFADVAGVSGFFRSYQRSVSKAGGVGAIPQHVSFFNPVRFTPKWLSDSGPGNRESDGRISSRCANWCDPQQPAYRQSEYGRVFAELYREKTGQALPVSEGPQRPELLVSGLPANEAAFLLPAEPARRTGTGLISAMDGTAWFVVPAAGRYILNYRGGERPIEIAPRAAYSGPGYDEVQRLSLSPR